MAIPLVFSGECSIRPEKTALAPAEATFRAENRYRGLVFASRRADLSHCRPPSGNRALDCFAGREKNEGIRDSPCIGQ